MIRSNWQRNLIALALACIPVSAFAGDATEIINKPVVEVPTYRSLGAYWIVKGDDNRNATVELAYRKAGSDEWKPGFPFMRVEKGDHHPSSYKKGNLPDSTLDVPDDGWLFAGSALMLEPNTAYEMKLTVKDPDGGEAEEVLQSKTIDEPKAPAPTRTLHVAAGEGDGGDGSESNPFKGLKAAQAQAQAGDLFLVHAGTYKLAWLVNKSGEEGKPIIWRGAVDGEAIIDATGLGEGDKPVGRVISAGGIHDVWFEDLTIRGGEYGVVAHDSGRLVFRRNNIDNVDYGITATKNTEDNLRGFWISDNVIKGPSTWPRSKGIEGARGIQVSGAGHVVAYNKVSNFGDAIDTFQGPRCEAIDFHNNDVSVLTDDGIELDFSHRNVRVFENRLTNVYQGITTQPIFGGPVYIFRNTMYNVDVSVFKLHNNPSGVYMFHNTIVKPGGPWMLLTSAPIKNVHSRNNLFLGTDANYAFVSEAKADNSTIDYEGIGGGKFANFLKWNGERFATLEDAKKKSDVHQHSVMVDPATAFKSGLKPPTEVKNEVKADVDFHLSENTAARDAGVVLPGINDNFEGKAPDLGAVEGNQPLPHYGPRPKK